MGTESSQTRARILNVTETIMVNDGYAAVSSRRIAKDAGVTAALVHYYFGTLDELFLEILRRRVDQGLERQRRLLTSSSRPLHAVWELVRNNARTGLVLEFMSLANHRKVIRTELAAYSEAFRSAQFELIADRVDRSAVESGGIPLLELLVLINAVGENLVLEQSIGMDLGHLGTAVIVEQFLERIEPETETETATT